MRRIRTLLIITLILLLFTGCDSAVPPETTLPPETTVPTETSEPAVPETTIPPMVSTEPAEPVHPDKAQLTADGFVPYEKEYTIDSGGSVWFWDAKYVYTGDSPEIELAIMEMTITLPEGWVDRVWVIQQGCSQDNGSVYITNRAITEAHREWAIRTYEQDGFVPDELYGWEDFMVRISRQEKIETEDYSNSYLRDSAGFLGETEEYYYFASLAQNQDPNCSEALLTRAGLLRDIGEEAYNALVGDLVLEYDTVRQMISIWDEIPAE